MLKICSRTVDLVVVTPILKSMRPWSLGHTKRAGVLLEKIRIEKYIQAGNHDASHPKVSR